MMIISEVKTEKDRKEFIDFPKWLYRNDPDWICPLDDEIERIFDPSRNHSFEHGVATRWILRDDENRIIGRVAAFIDRRRSAANKQPTGGLGFFEVIEDRDAAFLLFDTVKQWLSAQGMEAMDGPINFGENDSYWGLLVEGFMQQSYGMPYNKRYYKEFFESYGFLNYFEQYSHHKEVRGPKNEFVTFPERMVKIVERISQRPGYSFRHFEFRNSQKYINDICEIYNSTWTQLKEDFTPLNPDILNESLQKAKIIIDEEIIWFAYLNDKSIGFFILYPDLNQILRHLDGRMNFLNKLKFLYYKYTKEISRVRAVVGGVHYAYQNSGVESAIFFMIYKIFKQKTWVKELELSWVGDYNPKMLAIYKALGAIKVKTHVTYRYMINDKLPFRRYMDEITDKQPVK